MYDCSIIVKFLLLFTYLKDSDGHLSDSCDGIGWFCRKLVEICGFFG